MDHFLAETCALQPGFVLVGVLSAGLTAMEMRTAEPHLGIPLRQADPEGNLTRIEAFFGVVERC